MSNNHLITALDIGTSAIKGMCAARKAGNLKLEVLSKAVQPSLGVRRGAVINVEEISKDIKRLISQFERERGQKIEEVYVNINGSHLFSAFSRGSIIVSRADQKISEEDVERAIQASRVLSLPQNNEILDVFPKEYILDGERGIKDAVNMQGTKLEAEVLALGVFSPYFRNLTNAVLGADLEILDIVPSSLVSAKAVLTPREKELGVILLDIGAGTSGLAIFKEGNLVRLAVIPIGSANLTHDIAVGLKLDMDTAEKIKKEFGVCVLNGPDKKIKVEIPQPVFDFSGQSLDSEESDRSSDFESAPFTFSQRALVKIIEPRVSEILEQVFKEIKKAASRESFPAGIVLTGGGAKLSKIVEMTKREIKLPVRIGVPGFYPVSGEDENNSRMLKIINQEKDPIWSAACGLILEGADSEDNLNEENIVSRLKRIVKRFIP